MRILHVYSEEKVRCLNRNCERENGTGSDSERSLSATISGRVIAVDQALPNEGVYLPLYDNICFV